MASVCKICGKKIEHGDVGPECYGLVKSKILDGTYEYYNKSGKDYKFETDSIAIPKGKLKEIGTPKKIIEPKTLKFSRHESPVGLDFLITAFDSTEVSYYDGKDILETIKQSNPNFKKFFDNYNYESLYTPFAEDGETKLLGSLLLKNKN